jgi:hypothetical protein
MLRRSCLRYGIGHKAFSSETDPIAVAFAAGLETVVDGLLALVGTGYSGGVCSLDHFMYMLDVAWNADSASLLERVVDAFPGMLHPFDPWEQWDFYDEKYWTSCALAVLSVACKVGSVEVASRVLASEDFDPKEALRVVGNKNIHYQRLNWSVAYPGGVRYVTPKTRRSREKYQRHRFDFEETYGSFNTSRLEYNPFVVAASPEILELLLSDFRLSPIMHRRAALRSYIRQGRLDLLEVLAADPRVGWQSLEPFKLAVLSRNPEVIEFVLDRVDTESLSRESGENILRVAAQSREPAVLEALLARLPDQWKVSAWIKFAAKDVLHLAESTEDMLGMMEPLLASGLRPELGSELAHLVVTMNANRYPDLLNRRVDFLRAALADPRFDPAGCDNAAVKAAAESGNEEAVSLLMSDPRVNPQASSPPASSQASSPPAYSSEQEAPPAYDE